MTSIGERPLCAPDLTPRLRSFGAALDRLDDVLAQPKTEWPRDSAIQRFEFTAVVDAASELYREWHPSHGIDVNDAILAATAAATGGKIYTQNMKHFPMPDVFVLKGW